MAWILVVAVLLIAAAVALVVSHPEPGRIQPADPDLAEVRRLAETGRTIAAAELYRHITGVDLTTAKKAVERIVSGQPPRTPPPPER